MSSNRKRRSSKRQRNTRRGRNVLSRVQGTSVSPDFPFTVEGRATPIVYSISNGQSVLSTTSALVFNSPNLFSQATAQMITSMQEWRILRVTAKITPLSSTSGSSAFGFTMDSTSGLPASWQANARVKIVPNTNQGTHNSYTMTWTAKSFDDISFAPTSSTLPQPVAFYAYTNANDYGTPVVSANTPLFRVDFNVLLGLRGLGNV